MKWIYPPPPLPPPLPPPSSPFRKPEARGIQDSRQKCIPAPVAKLVSRPSPWNVHLEFHTARWNIHYWRGPGVRIPVPCTQPHIHIYFFCKILPVYGGNRQPGSRQRASPARNTTVAACARTAPAVMARSTIGVRARSNITFDKLPRSSKCPYMSRCASRAGLTQHDSSHENTSTAGGLQAKPCRAW